jgi:hypothetical protein
MARCGPLSEEQVGGLEGLSEKRQSGGFRVQGRFPKGMH